MKNKLAYWCYRYLVWYCNSFGKYDVCSHGCIFDDKRPRCGCIANIPTEWLKPHD